MSIEFANLSLELSGTQILDNLSGVLQKGKITAILGANGAGKSSLLSLLCGLQLPKSGQIKIDGQNIATIKPKVRAKLIGFLAQKSEIHWDIDVNHLVGLGRFAHDDNNQEIIDDALKQCDALHLKDRIAKNLSGGEQSRIMLARVLAGQPQWILADEPLANLDPAHQLDAIEIFKNAANLGAGVIIVLHDLSIATQIADEIITMKNGKIIAQGATQETLNPQIIAQAYEVEVITAKAQNGREIYLPIKRL